MQASEFVGALEGHDAARPIPLPGLAYHGLLSVCGEMAQPAVSMRLTLDRAHATLQSLGVNAAAAHIALYVPAPVGFEE